MHYESSRSSKVNDFHVIWKPICNFLLAINRTPRPYLAPFSQNTSVRRRTDDDNGKRTKDAIQHSCSTSKVYISLSYHSNFFSISNCNCKNNMHTSMQKIWWRITCLTGMQSFPAKEIVYWRLEYCRAEYCLKCTETFMTWLYSCAVCKYSMESNNKVHSSVLCNT